MTLSSRFGVIRMAGKNSKSGGNAPHYNFHRHSALRRLSDEGKTSFQSNVSRDLAKLEERKCIHKLNNSYFPISKNQWYPWYIYDINQSSYIKYIRLIRDLRFRRVYLWKNHLFFGFSSLMIYSYHSIWQQLYNTKSN